MLPTQIRKMFDGETISRGQVDEFLRVAGLAGRLPACDDGDGWRTDTIRQWAEHSAIRHRAMPQLTLRAGAIR